MSKIFIYGVPGVGKTHYSKILAKELGLPVIEADSIKKAVRENKSKKDYPFLYLGTCQAYSQFGELDQANTIKGLLAVRNAFGQAVSDNVNSTQDLILEGAFLDPIVLLTKGKVILLTTADEKIHRKQFLSHREKILDFQNNEFKAARIVQEYLISEAKSLGIEIINNHY